MAKTKRTRHQPLLSGPQLALVLGDFLLLAALIWNGLRLYRLHIKTQDILAGSILSGREEEFISRIVASGVPAWAWVVQIGALVITIALIVGWLVPKLRFNLPFALINTIWLGLWLAYFLLLTVVVAIVMGTLLNFT